MWENQIENVDIRVHGPAWDATQDQILDNLTGIQSFLEKESPNGSASITLKFDDGRENMLLDGKSFAKEYLLKTINEQFRNLNSSIYRSVDVYIRLR